MTVGIDTHKVGFVGLGIMAKGMARNVMKAGYEVHGYTRTKSKAQDLLDEGVIWHDTVADLAETCGVVITMVGYPQDVEQVYYGEGGILAHAKPGSYLVDMTTSSPSIAQRIANDADQRGLHALDAPVSGGDVGAREGKLAIMCGGNQDDFDAVKPLFETMGKSIALLGPAGAGQHTKMVNQIVISGTILGVAEAIAYAKKAGLDTDAVLDVIGNGAAGGFQLNVLGRRIAHGDYAPGFYVHHFQKDMNIAAAEAEDFKLDLRALKLAIEQYERYVEQGGRESGTQGIYELYED
ncbi:2-hydroxy-3-oxopropionate reductase [Caenispirillum salinarum AK4]|uniref:2-hydroxy-3-oxopropionate reductase n=1 Tax=Caenispirillum salinarum AK4 TaxID=1238182 RepID=K9H353_9PROT|nr:NAD(P)-dependent oxidoreductase [Caenispirillum salinarum]EKV31489.1 2-hydroxy-3-oxopropionate reductase [Caenispirillum salinarum AK4]